jgi:glycosyltransferase involved in cell wall biosynthesis
MIVKEAVLRLLSEFPQVKFSIRGIFTLPEEFTGYEEQIEILPFVDFDLLLEKTDLLDIIIAPLEINPYTQAKSELKYFEPAILEKPVVASPTEVFCRAIKDGDNGFIAHNSEEWYQKLKLLITDAEFRMVMGSKARENSLTRFGVTAQSQTIHRVFTSIWEDYFQTTEQVNLESLRVAWVVPAPLSGSGGHRVIFEICEYLLSVGHHVKIYFLMDPNFQHVDQIREFIATHFFEMKAEMQLGIDPISSCDALIATSWNTAATVYNHQKLAKDIFYFVQDFEPYFFPMSSDYIAAYGTYSMGLKHITIGDWLRRKLEAEFSATARSFPFPIDHSLYYPGESAVQQDKLQLAFFARNTMARRCYPLGVEALKILKSRYPEVNITLFGSKDINSDDFPYPHTNLGIITPQQLAELYRECIVGLAFSTTNPSIVPFEMMACGLPVIDLNFNQNDIHYGGLQNVTLANPNPNGIADAVVALIKNKDDWSKKRENGLLFAEALPTREESARLFEKLLVNYLSENDQQMDR